MDESDAGDAQGCAQCVCCIPMGCGEEIAHHSAQHEAVNKPHTLTRKECCLMESGTNETTFFEFRPDNFQPVWFSDFHYSPWVSTPNASAIYLRTTV